MLAVRHHAFGPPDVLRPERLPDPEPAGGQVRIAGDTEGHDAPHRPLVDLGTVVLVVER